MFAVYNFEIEKFLFFCIYFFPAYVLYNSKTLQWCYRTQVQLLATQKPILKRQVLVESCFNQKLSIWGEGGLMSQNQPQRFCWALTVFIGKKWERILVNNQGRRSRSVPFSIACRLADSSLSSFRYYLVSWSACRIGKGAPGSRELVSL